MNHAHDTQNRYLAQARKDLWNNWLVLINQVGDDMWLWEELYGFGGEVVRGKSKADEAMKQRVQGLIE